MKPAEQEQLKEVGVSVHMWSQGTKSTHSSIADLMDQKFIREIINYIFLNSKSFFNIVRVLKIN